MLAACVAMDTIAMPQVKVGWRHHNNEFSWVGAADVLEDKLRF